MRRQVSLASRLSVLFFNNLTPKYATMKIQNTLAANKTKQQAQTLKN